MILIVSYSGGIVNQVIDWIYSKGSVVHRINPYLENVNIKQIEISNDKFDIEFELEGYGITTKLSDYSGIWIWHSNLWFNNCNIPLPVQEENDIVNSIKSSLKNHHSILVDFFAKALNFINNKTIGNYNVQELNKLEVLLKAKSLGICIPDTYICSEKTQIQQLVNQKDLITKPYHEVVAPVYNGIGHYNYTSSVTANKIEHLSNEIFPTLIQEGINKNFEIRSFYLDGSFFSMAIFSQESTRTKSDFRNYNFENPNRNVPFNLPKNIEHKLQLLFEAFNLNSGSVDLIYTKENEFIFLEINPIGQFGMVSFPCNYYLEKKIAHKLMYGKLE